VLPFLSRHRVDLLLLLVAIAWGSTYLTAKELVTPASVFAMLSARMSLAAVVMALVLLLRRTRVVRAELIAGVSVGMLLAAVFVFETLGIAHTSATNAGLIVSLAVVFTPILDSLVSKRPLPPRFFLACTIAIAGVALLAGNGQLRPPSLGDGLVLVAALVRAVHVTMAHRITSGRPMDSLTITTVQMASCAVVFTVATLFGGESIGDYLLGLDGNELLLLLYLVLVCTVFAFFVQMWAIRRTSPSRVGLLLGTEPLWAAAIGILIAHDRLGVLGWCGVVLILLGTFWGRRVEERHRRELQEASVTPRVDAVADGPHSS
jgi:drug/metabolite transporter (DMT)-like permease